MELPDLLRAGPRAKAAIEYEGGETHTYASLDALADRYAHAFLALGLARGERVSFIAASDPYLIAAFIGCWRAGLVANPLNNRLTAPELAWILGHAGPRLLLTSPEFEPLAADALAQSGTSPVRALLRECVAGVEAAPLPPAVRPGPADGALLLYTSGTTGKPKGVMLSQANVADGVTYVRQGFEVRPEERALCVMPVFHTNGLMFSNLPFLLAGATVILKPRFSASAFWRQCSAHRATNASVSPTILAMLLEHEAAAPPAAEIRLDYIKVASAPTSPELAERFEARFGRGLILETFGLTETTCINTMNPLRGPRRRGSIGQALAPQALRIVDPEGRPLPEGAVGEIEIRGNTVMQGYFRDAEATARTVRDGWLRTGDLGRRDAEGFYYIVGRAKEMILRGGENISPLEVEAVAAAHPAVREAGAVGLPDRIYGEVVGLCVVAQNAVSADELRAFCRARLSAFKVPERIVFAEALPRNALGKVQRAQLRAHFGA